MLAEIHAMRTVLVESEAELCSPPDVCDWCVACMCLMFLRSMCGCVTSWTGTAQDLNQTGEDALKKQLYQSMVGQALFVKAEVEGWRTSNLWGLFTWQYNEIWPCGGWGSIEYGAPSVEGQVIGGRWKPLQYLLRSTVYTDVFATCCARCSGGTDQPNCVVKNDGVYDFNGTVSVSTFPFTSGVSQPLREVHVRLMGGQQDAVWFSIDFPADPTRVALEISVTVAGGASPAVVSSNFMLLAPPTALVLPDVTVTATVSDTVQADGTAVITVRCTGGAAVGVVLTTLAQGRFGDQLLHISPTEPRSVSFVPLEGFALDLPLLKQTLRVEHMQQMQ
eukprot:m.1267906 g.1267906  ORF g.1267906 m.1267906 type:complete len:334 (-) comp24743_c0_seq21:1549-2550(-)